MNRPTATRVILIALLVLVAGTVAASPASADVRVSRAELNGTQLRL